MNGNNDITPNTLFHANCVDVIKRIEDQTIDLIYLDPPQWPLTANKAYRIGIQTAEQQDDPLELISCVCQHAHRVLKPTGVIYFHTEPSAEFSVRLILNQVFGESNFRNTIVWQYRRKSHGSHEVIVHYGRSKKAINNVVFRPLTESEILRQFTNSDSQGRFGTVDLTAAGSRTELEFDWNGVRPPTGRSWRFNLETLRKLENEGRIYREKDGLPRLKIFLAESAGVDIGTVWSDIPPLTATSKENTRYPTQKPLGVLERLIQMGSNEGAIVLDPFCGTGTSLVAAERLRRRWIASDISKQAIEITAKRLIDEFGGEYSSSIMVRDAESLKGVGVKPAILRRLTTRVKDVPSIRDLEFVLDRAVPIEETRHFEFKEVKATSGAVDSIVNASDEYAVAFLNGEGGRIYWGIRDHDKTVQGVHLSYQQRDKVRRDVSVKINQIEPRLDPSRYRITIHQVLDQRGDYVPDLCVVELFIPAVDSAQPYFTGGGEAWVKVDGVKQKLKGTVLTEFIRRKLSK